METQLLGDLIIVFGLSITVIFLFLRIRVPSIIGFILTGILAGPHGLGLIGAGGEVEYLSDLGVVLLLFTIGIEFSLKNLLQLKRSVLLGGSLQVGITLAATYGFSRFGGLGWNESVFIGFLVSLSSTAIVLKLLDERAEITSPHGRNTVAVLIFQDLVVVPMMVVVPFIAGVQGGTPAELVSIVGKGVSLMGFVYLSYKWIVPRLLYQIAKTRSRELFLLSIVMICLGVAWLTSELGLSLALGAFLAGLIISESEYSHEALGRILPFRDIFVSFFFISIGMLLDVTFLLENIWLILSLAIGVTVLKATTGGLATLILGYPLRIAVLVGLALAQIGEFSFILSKTGMAYNLMDRTAYQIFLNVSLITMAATPFILNFSSGLADLSVRLPFPWIVKSRFQPLDTPLQLQKRETLIDHLLVIGFGVNGRNVSRAAKMASVPYVILEINPETVRKERSQGEPIYYGDATQEAVLKHVDVEHAKVAVIAIPDAAATRRITTVLREMNPTLHIIARTRFVSEVSPLYELGADEVIPEEFETSIEIFSRALSEYLIPRDDIERYISELRADGYKTFRGLSGEATAIYRLEKELPEFKVVTLRVNEGCSLEGKTLTEIEMRKRYHVSILAIRREEDTILNPGGEDILHPGDVVIVSGLIENILTVIPLLRAEGKSQG
ncbi:MAG TPA: cation:proton antiporter [Deltaproteobacteria bacterium]|nr:cation:proton antiporter [Deltaproteobacteria bacterium]HPJ94053.1 cation:proton antiporter [Deltaproteobacteria bacterium]HPR51217.1 cation:proton antiporter [Deltaproteobacteria bacterium]